MVSSKLTGEENWYTWSNARKLSLVSWAKLGFIDNTIKKPSENLEREAWFTVNGLVLSWIINSVIPNITCTIMHAGSAREAWHELEDRYRQSNDPKLYKIRHDLSNLKKIEDSVINYYNKIKAL